MKSFVLLLLVGGFALLSGSQMALAQNEAKLVAMNPQAGENSIYQLSFTTTDTLSPAAKIEIVLPSPFDISEVRLAGSSSINGGFRIETRNDSIKIVRSGLGQVILPGEDVELKFANVKNPRDIATDYVATMIIYYETRSAEGILISVDISFLPSGRPE